MAVDSRITVTQHGGTIAPTLDLVSICLAVATSHIVHRSNLRFSLDVELMRLDFHITSTWGKKKRKKARSVWVQCYTAFDSWVRKPEGAFYYWPGLCLMLSLEPHLDVTLLTSTFLFSICTCRKKDIMQNHHYSLCLLTKAMCLYLRQPLSYTRSLHIEDETQQDRMGKLGTLCASSLTLIHFILDEEAFCIIKLVHDVPIMKKE